MKKKFSISFLIIALFYKILFNSVSDKKEIGQNDLNKNPNLRKKLVKAGETRVVRVPSKTVLNKPAAVKTEQVTSEKTVSEEVIVLCRFKNNLVHYYHSIKNIWNIS